MIGQRVKSHVLGVGPRISYFAPPSRVGSESASHHLSWILSCDRSKGGLARSWGGYPDLGFGPPRGCENLGGESASHHGVRWTPRAWLWAQKHSGNIPGWFLSEFGTSENFRKKNHDFDPDFRHKSGPVLVVCRRIWLRISGIRDLI